MKGKSKREPPLTIPLKFDDAMRRALQVKAPPEGWAAYEKSAKKKRAHKGHKRKSAA